MVHEALGSPVATAILSSCPPDARGEPGDPEDNSTIAWPETLKDFRAGTSTSGQATPHSGAECEEITFDSLVMNGIVSTNDSVLL
jgi:catalase